MTRDRTVRPNSPEDIEQALLELLDPAANLSRTDRIGFFTIVLELLDHSGWSPDLLARLSPAMIATLKREGASGYRQDTASKAHVLYEWSRIGSVSDADLTELFSDARQDRDTRIAAMRILWSRVSVPNDVIVPMVWRFAQALLVVQAMKGRDEAFGLLDAVKCLYRLRERDAGVEALINQVYLMNRCHDESLDRFFYRLFLLSDDRKR